MNKLMIRPISINKCWQGRRFKTPEYSSWREIACRLIKGMKLKPVEGWVGIDVELRIKSFKTADGDNFIKPLFDALTEAGVIEDDRFIKWHIVEKFGVKSIGEEMIAFRIYPLYA